MGGGRGGGSGWLLQVFQKDKNQTKILSYFPVKKNPFGSNPLKFRELLSKTVSGTLKCISKKSTKFVTCLNNFKIKHIACQIGRHFLLCFCNVFL